MRETFIPKLLISLRYIFTRKMIHTVGSLYLEHPLSQTPCDFEIKRVRFKLKKAASCRKLLVLRKTLPQTVKNFV